MTFGRRFAASLSLLVLTAGVARAQRAPWVTVHYPYWEENVMTPGQIDLTTATDLIYFSAIPQANGGLDTSNLDEPGSVATAAHAASRPALLCVGGGGYGPAFASAVQPAHAAKLVREIVQWVKTNGFDGVDIDFEPLPQSSSANFRAFIQQLHTALKAYSRTAVLTGDFQPDAADAKAAFPSRSYFDQVNVMTYDMSGAYEGWVTWYDSCIYSTGTFPSTGAPLPSTDMAIREWLAAGFQSEQLGVGIETFGYIWTNATAPQQAITTGTAPGDTQTSEMTYRDIMADLYASGTYHYDSAAKAPWLGLTSSDEFVSYTDPALCADKMTYVQGFGIGGVVIWDITGQYQGGENPFLSSIKTVLNGIPNENLNWSYWDGTYPGVIATGTTGTVAGTVSMTVSGSGNVTLTAGWGSPPVTFHGAFDASGVLHATTGRGKLPALTASATLQLSDTESATVSGVLTDGTDSENWYAHEAVYNAVKKPCPAAGSYVCTLSSTSGGLAPQGTSRAVLTINRGGVAKLKGKLPDGTAFQAAGHIDTSGVLILYASLYGKLGYLQGCPDWSSAPEISGQLAWGKFAKGNKAGFATEVQISGQ